MSSITVNVTATTNAPDQTIPKPADDAIRAEARRRLEVADADRLAAARLIADEERKKSTAIEISILEEQVRLRVQEEQIRLMAQRAAAEAEVKRLTIEREEAIAAEILRLKNRTEVEILRDTVAELQAQISELKTGFTVSYRQ